MKKRVKSRVINKVISGVSVFMFTVGFATHAGIVKKCAVGEYPKSEIDRYQAA